MKRPTRKKLLEAIDQIVGYSMWHPVMQFMVNFADENGVPLWDATVELHTIDDLVATLMDKSLSHRIVRISSEEFVLSKGTCVFITLMPDREHRTNIDAKFLEKIMELEVESYESGC